MSRWVLPDEPERDVATSLRRPQERNSRPGHYASVSGLPPVKQISTPIPTREIDLTETKPASPRLPQHRLPVRRPRVLLVEDSPSDAGLVRAWLGELGADEFELHVVTRVQAAVQHLSDERADVVLLDLTLPDAEGLEAVETIVRAAPEVPIVVLSGAEDERLAVSAVRDGAQDYLLKNRVDSQMLWRAIRYAMERKRSELAISHHAFHDGLTGLGNRRLFMDRLQLAIDRLGRRESSLAVLFFDLDRFKIVNDSLGHEAGDQLIVDVARRLQRVLRPSDSAARFGGDEFLVLCEDIQTPHDAMVVAERIQGALAVPFVVDDAEVHATASIGIVVTSSSRVTPESLVRDADSAMYRAKELGKNRCELFDSELREAANVRLVLENDLHRAVQRHEFEVHYQPVVDLHTQRMVGAEALVRWRRPDGALVEPGSFIGLAEETGLVLPIGEFVHHTAVDEAAGWGSAAVPTVGVPLMSINLSARQLVDSGFTSRVERDIAAAGLDPAAVCLEVTESTLMRAEGSSEEVLRELKDLGLQLCIDDFGTGYSSLTYLQRYPFDSLKIDRSFIRGLGVDEGDTAIVHAVVDLAKALRLVVIAEGVETDDQARHLLELGCGLAQGFLFAEPAPGGVVGALLGHELPTASVV